MSRTKGADPIQELSKLPKDRFQPSGLHATFQLPPVLILRMFLNWSGRAGRLPIGPSTKHQFNFLLFICWLGPAYLLRT